MSKYLVIEFNRYHTERSVHTYVDADSFKEAIIKVCQEDDPRDFSEYIDDMMVIDDDFASIAEEESDILVYQMQPGLWHHADHS